MTDTFIPPRRAVGTRPHGIPRINHGSRQARGLVFWVAGGHPYDAVNRTVLTPVNGPLLGGAGNGRGRVFEGGPDSAYYTFPAGSPLDTLTEFTQIFWMWVPVGASATFELQPFHKDGGGSSLNSGIAAHFDGSGPIFFGRVSVDGGTAKDAAITIGSGGAPAWSDLQGTWAMFWQSYENGSHFAGINTYRRSDAGNTGTLDVQSGVGAVCGTDQLPQRFELDAGFYLDDIRIYNRVLRHSEILEIYNPATRFDLWQSYPRRIIGGAAAGGGHTATPGKGALQLTGYSPTVTFDFRRAPGKGTLTLLGYQPTAVVTTGGITALPGAGSLQITGLAPTVSFDFRRAPGAGALQLAGLAPTSQVVVQAAPGLGALAFTGYAPSVAFDFRITPGVGTLALQGYEPLISVGTPGQAFPGVGSLKITGHAPLIAISGAKKDRGAGPDEKAIALSDLNPQTARRLFPELYQDEDVPEPIDAPSVKKTPYIDRLSDDEAMLLLLLANEETMQ